MKHLPIIILLALVGSALAQDRGTTDVAPLNGSLAFELPQYAGDDLLLVKLTIETEATATGTLTPPGYASVRLKQWLTVSDGLETTTVVGADSGRQKVTQGAWEVTGTGAATVFLDPQAWTGQGTRTVTIEGDPELTYHWIGGSLTSTGGEMQVSVDVEFVTK